MSRIAFNKFIICVFYQAFKQLCESVACLRTYDSQESEVPVEPNACVKCQETILPFCVAAHCFNHQNMMELIMIFGVHYLFELGHTPPTQGRVEVEHTHLAVVRLTRNCFKNEKSLYWSILASSGYQISNKVEHHPSHWVHFHWFFSRHLS